MYARRYTPSGGLKPGSLLVAVGINAAVIAALAFSTPVFKVVERNNPFVTTNIPLDPVPPEIVPEPIKQTEPTHSTPRPERIASVPRELATPSSGPLFITTTGPAPRPEPYFVTGGGGVIVDIPTPVPVLVGATADPRFAGAFQPDYPASERHAGMEGLVTIRVLIGTDGRVKKAERIAAASDAFWRATERQALGRWRFRPATRDGAPVESWQTKTVRFVLEA